VLYCYQLPDSDTKSRVLYAQCAALDGRSTWKARVASSFGVSRNVRRGTIVALSFISGLSNYPVIIGHMPNEETNPGSANPLPPPHMTPSDQVYYHPETGAFLKMSSAKATPTDPGPDNAPGLIDIELASGAAFHLSESDDRTYGSVTLNMPSGATLQLADASSSSSAFTLTLPSGFSMQVDASGNLMMQSPGTAHIESTGPMTIDSSASVEVSAPSVALNSANVALGGTAGSGRQLAFQDQLQEVRDFLAVHNHSGVQGGPGNTGPPVGAPIEPTGTTNTKAV
jgi:hypothetical protein